MERRNAEMHHMDIPLPSTRQLADYTSLKQVKNLALQLPFSNSWWTKQRGRQANIQFRMTSRDRRPRRAAATAEKAEQPRKRIWWRRHEPGIGRHSEHW